MWPASSGARERAKPTFSLQKDPGSPPPTPPVARCPPRETLFGRANHQHNKVFFESGPVFGAFLPSPTLTHFRFEGLQTSRVFELLTWAESKHCRGTRPCLHHGGRAVSAGPQTSCVRRPSHQRPRQLFRVNGCVMHMTSRQTFNYTRDAKNIINHLDI